MAWPYLSKLQIARTLEYFDRYDYPLTKKELEFWAGAKVQRHKGTKQYFYLPKRQNLVNLRLQREKNSLPKWGIAYEAAVKLAKIPFVAAIFVTGSLAMNNCKKTDDIDLMIVTSPNTLWITRFIVNIIFIKHRRFPGAKTAPDKICPNLWLDIRNLKLEMSISSIKNLYVAHELLQAKCIFDRSGVHKQFLKTNSWVKKYLPNAFQKSYQVSSIKYYAKPIIHNTHPIIQILNWLLFILQYLYMLPRKTTEVVGPDYAFFHPKG